MESFIDKLNSTLNAANKLNESEAEEIKDEIIEDLEEEALQAEGNDDFETDEDEETRKNTIINQAKNKIEYKHVKPKKPSFKINGAHAHAHANDYEDDFDDEEENSDTLKRNTNNKDDVISNMIPIGTLGATNHMHNRINSLEK